MDLLSVFHNFETEINSFIDRMRSEYEVQIGSMVNEIKDLQNKIKQMDDIVYLKDMELLGLRRQLKTYALGNPLCSQCTKHVNVVDRKRALANTSVSESVISPRLDGKPSMPSSRPQRKRRCTVETRRAALFSLEQPKLTNQKASILVPGTEDFNAVYVASKAETGSKNEAALSAIVSSPQSSPTPTRVCEEASLSTSPHSAPTLTFHATGTTMLQSLVYPMQPGSFSPPSGLYDASAAIRQAVNHADLADIEHSLLQPLLVDEEPIGPRKVRTIKLASKPVLTEHSNLRMAIKQRSSAPHKTLRHKPTCRHYHCNKQENQNPNKRSLPDSDVTGADLTFPSVISSTDGTQLDTKLSNSRDKDACTLPSIGGSPTADQIFKRPAPPPEQGCLSRAQSSTPADKRSLLHPPAQAAAGTAMDAALGRPFGASDRRFDYVMQPSTPEGFWRIDISTPRTQSPHNPDMVDEQLDAPGLRTDVNWKRKLRRRRPLVFPKPVSLL